MTKLYRSQRDKKLFGLCGGIAEAINVDATILRLVVVVTAVFSGGTVILLYLIACLVIPKEPSFDPVHYGSQHHQYPPGPGSHNSYAAKPVQKEYVPQESVKTNIDEMMKDIEKKAMLKEIEQLRAKVAKYEKEEE